ncbi:MAG: Hsp20/alpha crystallin family protein [Cytophagales bacterium]|nr:Hsp20/alpha crystallin family protein [Cytophagales bacterium]
MALVKYNPSNYSPVTFRSFVDRFFNEDIYNGGTAPSQFAPKVDIAETDQQFEIDFYIPGVNKDQVNIDLNDGRLTVSGERKLEKENNGKNYRSVESSYGSFTRSFQLPDNIDQEAVSASFENGVLRITIPKDEKKIAKRSIAIK